VLYFAYASNLAPRQMHERSPGHTVVGVAAFPDHRIEFRGRSERWDGATATPVLSHGARVWGVVYEVSEADLQALDQFEGFQGPGDQHNIYDRQWITVDLERPLDGSVPRRVRTHSYFIHHGGPGRPSRRYLETILEGARHHRLPEEYIEKLARTEVEGE
jgi:gamma-glutamylcyclotransferase (GGCT)/AIG2-like uncharacterized protein YtfP